MQLSQWSFAKATAVLSLILLLLLLLRPLLDGPKTMPLHLTATGFRTPEPFRICVIFGTRQRRKFVLNTSINAIFVNFVAQLGAT